MISNKSQSESEISVPGNFAVCHISDCVHSKTCLRCIAAGLIPQHKMFTISVNPGCLTEEQLKKGTCSVYVKAERVVMARGFRNAFNTVPLGNKKQVEAQLRNRFCQAVYYRIRKGARVLTPEEQKFVEQVLIDNGAQSPIVFDTYEEDYLWNEN